MAFSYFPGMMDDEIHGLKFLPRDLTALKAAMADNNPISESLESIARRLIAIGEAQLALLDEQTGGLERTPRELRESREKNVNYIHQYHTVIAPHRKLPHELLSNIFKHAVDRVELPFRTGESILILKQICRKWSDVVSQTFALWANIDIDVTQDIEGIAKRLFVMSGDLPLSIELRNYRCMEESFEVPRLYAERCKDLVIRGDALAIERLFRPHSQASLSSLLSLTIRATNTRHQEDTQTATSLPFLETAVNLRQLTFSVSSFNFCAAIGQLSLFNLTYLNVSDAFLDPLILFPIMSRCPSLVTCMIMLVLHSPTTHAEDIMLPSIRHLRVRVFLPESYCWMIGVIMPSLSHLTLAGSSFPEPEAYQYTISHSNDLEILEIETSALTDLESVLQITPSISQLWIHAGPGECTLPESVLEGLATGELLPRLSILECAPMFPDELEAYVDMIEKRSQAQSAVSIKEVDFLNWDRREIGESLLPRLKKLQEGGLIVRFSIDDSLFGSAPLKSLTNL